MSNDFQWPLAMLPEGHEPIDWSAWSHIPVDAAPVVATPASDLQWWATLTRPVTLLEAICCIERELTTLPEYAECWLSEIANCSIQSGAEEEPAYRGAALFLRQRFGIDCSTLPAWKVLEGDWEADGRRITLPLPEVTELAPVRPAGVKPALAGLTTTADAKSALILKHED